MTDIETRQKKRILTGVRPTGRMHLGHYVGALKNWLKLQNEYECFFLIADYQALTDFFEAKTVVRNSIGEIVLDWLSLGLDPRKSNFVLQSMIPEHAELAMLLSFITSIGRLERNPTLKSELELLPNNKKNAGFYFYPISQAADILLPNADLVPVGEDQVPHIEMTREIAAKFNRMYGKVFNIPEALVGETGRLVGTDGHFKMSKSKNNAIYLSSTPQEVENYVGSMYTDPKRIKATDPGTVEGNPVFIYHEIFNTDKNELSDFKQRYTEGKIGDVEVKKSLAYHINNFLQPLREKRKYFKSKPFLVKEAILEGTERSRKICRDTILQVRQKMGLNYGN